MREVITVQFGNFANFVGSHFWNFQDELLGQQDTDEVPNAAQQICSDTIYRSGQTPQGFATYTPRLVLFDLKGSLGGVSSRGALYFDATAPSSINTWDGPSEVHRSHQIAKSSFITQLEKEESGRIDEDQDQDQQCQVDTHAIHTAAQRLNDGAGVQYFTDFLKANLHPRSINQMQDRWHGISDFGGFGAGGAHSASLERREDMLESIRFFAEECDLMQGFQCFVDDMSGFGQIGTDVLQELRDTYSGVPVMLFAVRPALCVGEGVSQSAVPQRHILSEALSYALLSQESDTFSVIQAPVSYSAFENLNLVPGNIYHDSAVCAASIDTVTLPLRLSAGLGAYNALGGLDMKTLTQLLAGRPTSPLVHISLGFPAALPPDDVHQAQQQGTKCGSLGTASHMQELSDRHVQSTPFTRRGMVSLTPGITVAAALQEAYVESIVLRGSRLCSGLLPLNSAGALLDAALSFERVRCVRSCTLVSAPLPIPLPFPGIFGPNLSSLGLPMQVQRPVGVQVESCPTLSRAAGSTAFKPALQQIVQKFARTAASAHGKATLEGWGYDSNDLESAHDRLCNLITAYDGDEF